MIEGMLVGRGTETRLLAELLAAAAAGSAGAVQLVGEAGIGKSALIEDVAGRAPGFRVLHAVGVPEEAHLASAVLLALLHPLQHLVPALPPTPGGATGVALGLPPSSADGALGLPLDPAAGELARGAACLGLLALAAESAPVLVLADDLQWWDEESWRALSFAVRRLGGERIAVVLASRPDGRRQLAGIPTVALPGLGAAAAEELLAADHPFLTAGVCRQLTTRTGGNPLALLEAAGGLDRRQLRGGATLPDILPTSAGLQDYFGARTATLPVGTRDLLLLAALAAPGDLGTIATAAARTGTPLSELAAAEQAGLVTLGEQRVDFRHLAGGGGRAGRRHTTGPPRRARGAGRGHRSGHHAVRLARGGGLPGARRRRRTGTRRGGSAGTAGRGAGRSRRRVRAGGGADAGRRAPGVPAPAGCRGGTPRRGDGAG